MKEKESECDSYDMMLCHTSSCCTLFLSFSSWCSHVILPLFDELPRERESMRSLQVLLVENLTIGWQHASSRRWVRILPFQLPTVASIRTEHARGKNRFNTFRQVEMVLCLVMISSSLSMVHLSKLDGSFHDSKMWTKRCLAVACAQDASPWDLLLAAFLFWTTQEIRRHSWRTQVRTWNCWSPYFVSDEWKDSSFFIL